MFPLLPLLTGVALGVTGALVLKNKKTQEKLNEGKENIEAIVECAKDKVAKKRGQITAEGETK